jgi:hypothetical protein
MNHVIDRHDSKQEDNTERQQYFFHLITSSFAISLLITIITEYYLETIAGSYLFHKWQLAGINAIYPG